MTLEEIESLKHFEINAKGTPDVDEEMQDLLDDLGIDVETTDKFPFELYEDDEEDEEEPKKS